MDNRGRKGIFAFATKNAAVKKADEGVQAIY
jgi:hypothetical protein